MTLPRILILGILALVAIYVIASAIAIVVPYAAGLFIAYIVFLWFQRTLAAKDAKGLSNSKPPAPKR